MPRRVRLEESSPQALPPELGGPAVVEAWVSADEIAAHTYVYGSDCPACPDVSLRNLTCGQWLQVTAAGRQRDARDQWLDDHHVPRRDAGRGLIGER